MVNKIKNSEVQFRYETKNEKKGKGKKAIEEKVDKVASKGIEKKKRASSSKTALAERKPKRRGAFLSDKQRWCYHPDDKKVFAVSRSALQQYLNCELCFYRHRRDGIKGPDSFPLTLNLAVDQLLKNEFDSFREKQSPHPIMKKLKKDYGISAVPYKHPDKKEWEEWRFNFKGMRTLHEKTGLEVFGSLDDLWIDTKTKELYVVDYKATSKKGPIGIDEEWQESYKNQMDVYQWILKQKGYKVADKAFFVYVNGRKNEKSFNESLKFDTHLICYEGNSDWIESTLQDLKKTIESDLPPKSNPACKLCNYVDLIKDYSKMVKELKSA